jgi:hypothetical protein
VTGYQFRLRSELNKHGWELSEIIDKDLEWWADEQWYIKSVREHWGLEIYITFLVDPHWSGSRKKGQAIWAVMASSKLPNTWSQEISQITRLSLLKGKFDSKLEQFIDQLNTYRINLKSE